MRSCQIRLDMRPRTIGNNWERTVAEEVDARYVDLVMQSMLQEFMGMTVADHIRDRLLDLQVPLRPIVCLRLRQIARDEARKARKAALRLWEETQTPDVGNNGLMKLQASVRSFTQRLAASSSRIDDDSESDEEDAEAFEELVGAKRLSGNGAENGNYSENLDAFSKAVDLQGDKPENAKDHVWMWGGSKRPTNADESQLQTPSKRGPFGGVVVAAESTEDAIALDIDKTGSMSNIAKPTEIVVKLDVVEVNVLVHSLWTSVLRAKPHPPVPRKSKSTLFRTKSRVASDVGGFGFERFGVPVMPRNQLIRFNISKLMWKAQFPWTSIHGASVSNTWATMAIHRMYAHSPMAPAKFQRILQFEPCVGPHGSYCFEIEMNAETKAVDGDVAASPRKAASPRQGAPFVKEPSTAESSQSDITRSHSTSGRYIPPQDKGKNQQHKGATERSKAVVRALRDARWTVSVRTGHIDITAFEPTMQRLVGMLRKGSRKTQAQAEFESTGQAKTRTRKRGLSDRVFAQVHARFPGTMDLKGDIGTVEVHAVLRYFEKNVLFVEAKLPHLLPSVHMGGQPLALSFDVGSVHTDVGVSRTVVESVGKNLVKGSKKGTHPEDSPRPHGHESYPLLLTERPFQDSSVWKTIALMCQSNCAHWKSPRSSSDSLQIDPHPDNAQLAASETGKDLGGRSGASALAWAGGKFLPMNKQISQDEELIESVNGHEGPEVFPDVVMPLITMIKHLPWSVQMHTVDSHEVGLSRGNLSNRQEDFYFLDAASIRALFARRAMTSNSAVDMQGREGHTTSELVDIAMDADADEQQRGESVAEPSSSHSRRGDHKGEPYLERMLTMDRAIERQYSARKSKSDVVSEFSKSMADRLKR